MKIEIGTVCLPGSTETRVLIRHIGPNGEVVAESHFTPKAARGLVKTINKAADMAESQ
ncbi:hypothetical protein [Pseudooceanicola sp.]|uniref:hypothetical protein n=1 Tax=Pseudooceanicola sp. TaxID=1914328 RepID=UPI00351330CC